MIYYPLCTLMQANIKDILIITTPHESAMFEALLGDGSQWGITLTYTMQASPRGIAEAFLIGEDFIGKDSVCLILGDNILYGEGLADKLQHGFKNQNDALIFGYNVSDPARYGVIVFDEQQKPVKIVEKPQSFLSSYAVIGLYFYHHNVINVAKNLKPSQRGELEITDINQYYLDQKKLSVEKLGAGIAWLDTGTHQTLLEAANFIHVLEKRQGLKIGCPEEVAWRMGMINSKQLKQLAESQIKNGYGDYLFQFLD